MIWLTQIAVAILAALGGGGVVGAWFTHRRELPKVKAEVRVMDWQRFQKEIDRLDKKIAAQDLRIEELESEVATCHETKELQTIQLAKQENEIAELTSRLVVQERSHNG
jgi:uncharacterized coiled-coil protein SlyX